MESMDSVVHVYKKRTLITQSSISTASKPHHKHKKPEAHSNLFLKHSILNLVCMPNDGMCTENGRYLFPSFSLLSYSLSSSCTSTFFFLFLLLIFLQLRFFSFFSSSNFASSFPLPPALFPATPPFLLLLLLPTSHHVTPPLPFFPLISLHLNHFLH